jgi:hypothetical protein
MPKTKKGGEPEDTDEAPDTPTDITLAVLRDEVADGARGTAVDEEASKEGEISINAGRSENEVTPHTLSPRSYSAAVRNEPATYSVAFTEVEELAVALEASRSAGSAAGESVEFYTGNPSVVQYKGQVLAPLIRSSV